MPLNFISIVSATSDQSTPLQNPLGQKLRNSEVSMFTKEEHENDDFKIIVPTCDDRSETSQSPFVVIVLYKTSGNYLGLGAIISKKIVMTTEDVVRNQMKEPHTLLVVSGSRSPWWGKNSQIRKVLELIYNDIGLILMTLKKELLYDKNTKPIKIPSLPAPADYELEYGSHWAVFGLPRSSWDVPGERVNKAALYSMKVETKTQKKPHTDDCKATYPDVEFNDTVMECAYANASMNWGVVGSPVVGVDQNHKMWLIAMLHKATHAEPDDYHIMIKPTYFETWIRSFGAYCFELWFTPEPITDPPPADGGGGGGA